VPICVAVGGIDCTTPSNREIAPRGRRDDRDPGDEDRREGAAAALLGEDVDRVAHLRVPTIFVSFVTPTTVLSMVHWVRSIALTTP